MHENFYTMKNYNDKYAYYTWLAHAHLHVRSCSLVWSLPDTNTKGSLTGSLPSQAMALSCAFLLHQLPPILGNHESTNTGVSFEFLHGSSCGSVSNLTLETASLKKNSVCVIFHCYNISWAMVDHENIFSHENFPNYGIS